MRISDCIAYRGSLNFDFVTTNKPIEAKYTALSLYEVSYIESNDDSISNKIFKITTCLVNKDYSNMLNRTEILTNVICCLMHSSTKRVILIVNVT